MFAILYIPYVRSWSYLRSIVSFIDCVSTLSKKYVFWDVHVLRWLRYIYIKKFFVDRPNGRASHVAHPQTNRRGFRTKLTKVIRSKPKESAQGIMSRSGCDSGTIHAANLFVMEKTQINKWNRKLAPIQEIGPEARYGGCQQLSLVRSRGAEQRALCIGWVFWALMLTSLLWKGEGFIKELFSPFAGLLVRPIEWIRRGLSMTEPLNYYSLPHSLVT